MSRALPGSNADVEPRDIFRVRPAMAYWTIHTLDSAFSHSNAETRDVPIEKHAIPFALG